MTVIQKKQRTSELAVPARRAGTASPHYNLGSDLIWSDRPDRRILLFVLSFYCAAPSVGVNILFMHGGDETCETASLVSSHCVRVMLKIRRKITTDKTCSSYEFSLTYPTVSKDAPEHSQSQSPPTTRGRRIIRLNTACIQKEISNGMAHAISQANWGTDSYSVKGVRG